MTTPEATSTNSTTDIVVVGTRLTKMTIMLLLGAMIGVIFGTANVLEGGNHMMTGVAYGLAVFHFGAAMRS